MPPDDRLYPGHMPDAARKSVARAERLDRAGFDADEDVRLALIHLIQTSGEAARRVSPDERERHPEIPWRQAIGMRHKIVHDYFAVDEDVVWQVATTDLPPIAEALGRLFTDEPVNTD